MKGFILKPHEAQALAAGKPVVIWRVCKLICYSCKGGDFDTPDDDTVECSYCGKEYGSSDLKGWAGEPCFKIPFPVGVPLFGKETWQYTPTASPGQQLQHKASKPQAASYEEWASGGDMWMFNVRWKSSASMPEWASRITLTLSDVKVRRPCDVTGEEACDMLTEECRAKAPYMETKGVLADWHIRAFRKQFSLHYKTDWNLYHFTALAMPA